MSNAMNMNGFIQGSLIFLIPWRGWWFNTGCLLTPLVRSDDVQLRKTELKEIKSLTGVLVCYQSGLSLLTGITSDIPGHRWLRSSFTWIEIAFPFQISRSSLSSFAISFWPPLIYLSLPHLSFCLFVCPFALPEQGGNDGEKEGKYKTGDDEGELILPQRSEEKKCCQFF